MCDYDITTILAELEEEMETANPDRPEPMRADRWLLASAIQKAIRRGESERAANAASALWSADPQSFWRRLHVTALEDIGVANPNLLIQVLAATSSSVWRRRQGDLRVALHLTRRLCESVKCRLADETFIVAERAPQYTDLRAELAVATDEKLAGYVANESADLIKRLLSLWFIAGTKKYPSEVVPTRKGEPADAVELLRSIAAPMTLVESCIGVINRTPYPLALFTPLLWQAVNRQQEPATIRTESIPVMPLVDGVPLYAADMFTRVGGASYRQLQKTVPALAQISTRQLGLAVFYAEGGKCDRILSSEYLDTFRDAGETGDIEGNGLCIPSYLGLRECLAENMELLQKIRAAKLRQHLREIV